MNRRAMGLLAVVQTAAIAMGGTPIYGARRSTSRRKETIDDVLDRARRRRGKPAYDPTIDGKVEGAGK